MSTPTHGVYDILETKPGTHRQYPVTFKSIKARTFPDDLTAAGKNQLLLDVPLTIAACSSHPAAQVKVLGFRHLYLCEWTMCG